MGESRKMVDARITWEGCSVLLDINDGDRIVFARLSPSSTLKIGNKNLSLRPLMGCPFGSLFQVETGPKGSILVRVSVDTQDAGREDNSQLKDTNKDNRSLVDNNSAQSLSSEDIECMRRDGATGGQIIEALIANSSTFESKTSFSQEKYKLKKQKKYAPRVLLRRPYARSICEAYFKKHPYKIEYLRMDTLSLLLSMGNVCAYSDVLVVDMVGGMVTGAIAERLGGTGHVCNMYFGQKPYPMDIVRIFNFSNETCSRILQTSFPNFSSSGEIILHACVMSENNSLNSQFNCVEKTATSKVISHDGQICLSSADKFQVSGSCLDGDASSISMKNGPKENNNMFVGQDSSTSDNNGMVPMKLEDCSSCDLKESTLTDEKNISSASIPIKSSKAGRPPSSGEVQRWKKNGFTSLIIAAPELDTWKIVRELLPLISYSTSFAIYHQYLQPLAECMHHLQSSKMAIALQISEPWLREYQVLPSRTHPHMQMSSFGGYILSGIRICNDEYSQKSKNI